MSLRKFLLLPLVISLAFFVYFSGEVRQSFVTLLSTVHLTAGLLVALTIAIVLQLAGHIIRAYKARLIFGVAKESSVRFQFRALSIGYLFDTVLPFRLGELIRGRVISGAMTISFGYALTLIVFERLVDSLFLGLFGLLLMLQSTYTPHAFFYVILLLVIGGVGMTIYYILAWQNKYALKLCYQMTRLLNDKLKTTVRFKIWTVIYGLQQTLKWRILAPYIALTAASWLFYGASLFVIVAYLFRHISVSGNLVTAAAPYYGVAVPAGPASLGVFSKIVNNFTAYLHLSSQMSLTYNLTAWAVLVIPIAFIGLALLYTKTKETLWYDRPKKASTNALTNKLHRTEDISGEMSVFLENYFSGNTLSRIVHDLEVRDEFKLVKYFKGGSDAITILVIQDGKQVVKKIIPLEFESRLKAQYDWLISHQKKGVVPLLAEHHADNYYAIDLAYDEQNEAFYEFIHKNVLNKSKRVLDDTWGILAKSVYGRLSKCELHPKERERYIKRHIFDCLEKAAAVNPELIRASEPEKLFINGVEYDNLHQIMKKIRKHEEAWRDIAMYRQSKAVHGDVIMDNLLVSKKTGEVLIIDPAPDGNVIEGPVFDFGKMLQSLYCGYETLLRDEDPVFLTDGNVINYRDQKSGKYGRLSAYVSRELAPKYLTKSEQHAMLFHAGTLYIRRLKHQVYYTPANAMKFYAVGVRILNDFYNQYE